VWFCLCDSKFIRFSRTPTCDRQTQTDRHGPMASIADALHRAVIQEAQLSPRDRANCHATVQIAETTCTTSPEHIEVMKLEG